MTTELLYQELMETFAPSCYHYRAKSSFCGTVGYSSLTKKQRIIFSSGEKEGTEPAENGALKDEAGRAGSAAGDLENADARKHGRLVQDGNKRKRIYQRDGRLDIFSGESCSEKGKSPAGNGPAVPDGVRKIPLLEAGEINQL